MDTSSLDTLLWSRGELRTLTVSVSVSVNVSVSVSVNVSVSVRVCEYARDPSTHHPQAEEYAWGPVRSG